MEKPSRINRHYCEACLQQIEKTVDSMLASLVEEIHIHSLLQAHLIQGTQVTLQIWKSKEDLYKRSNFYTKVRRHNSGVLECTIASGIFGQLMLQRVPNFLDEKAFQQNKEADASSVSSVMKHNIM